MPKLTLKPHTAMILIDVIDMHVEGLEEAKEATTDDPTIASAEQLLDMMSGYDDQLKELADVREQLNTPTVADMFRYGYALGRRRKHARH